jgi:hypothetical protein
MKKFFGFGSSNPAPPAPPSKTPEPPPAKPASTPLGSKSEPSAGPKREGTESPSIVGRWKEPNGKETTEFHTDGTVTERTATGENIRGRYSLRDKQLKVNLDGVPNELSFPVAIGPKTLEMTDTDGKVTLYERMP